MDRLSIILTLMTGAVLTGALAVTAMAFGWYGWLPLLGSAAIGILLSWPVAYLISRRIKREDPNWSAKAAQKGPFPKPGAKEI